MKICLACERRFESGEWLCPACGHVPERRDGFPSFAPELSLELEGYDPAYFSQLVQFEPWHFWFVSRNRLLLWAVRRYFPAAATFLEIGCGTGYVLSGLRGRYPALRLAGSEALSEGLKFAARRVPDADLFQMDARRTPFEAEFDVVGAFDVLEHVEEDEAVLAGMFRACRPGGGIMLTVPQHGWLWSSIDELAHHKRRYSREELLRKVRLAGFEPCRATSFVSLLLPLMLASRLRRKRVPQDPWVEWRIGKTVNGALRFVLGFERTLIERGLSFPAGGSLLVVARRPYDAERTTSNMDK